MSNYYLVIRQFSDIPKDEWDAFIKNNTMGYAYHLSDMLVMKAKTQDKNISFAILDDTGIIFVIALHLAESKIGPFKSYHIYSRHGYVFKDGIGQKQSRKVSECFIEYIDLLHSKYKINDDFWIEFPALMQSNIPAASVNPVIFMGFAPNVRYTSVVDLRKDTVKILADCEQTARQSIRKMEVRSVTNLKTLDNTTGEGYIFVEGNPCDADYEAYIRLNTETYKRTGAILNKSSYYRHLIFNLIPAGLCKLFFIKKISLEQTTEEYISAAIILIYKNTAYYFWGCSKDEKDNGINIWLIYRIMIYMKESGVEYFETGGVYPYLRTGRQKGRGDFKKKFGGFLHPIYGGVFVKSTRYEMNIFYQLQQLLRKISKEMMQCIKNIAKVILKRYG